jgi:hypothetical protein
MKQKKDLTLSIILSLLLGPLGLFYSTIVGGVILFILATVVCSIGLVSNSNFLISLTFLILNPTAIFWGALVVKKKNKLANLNMTITTEEEINFGGDAFSSGLGMIFFSLTITALFSLFNENNILSNNIYVFSILVLLLTLYFAFLKENESAHTS